MLDESGHGISMVKTPSVLVSCTVYDVTDARQPAVATDPANGDVSPLAATSATVVVVVAAPLPQSSCTTALMAVPRAGAST